MKKQIKKSKTNSVKKTSTATAKPAAAKRQQKAKSVSKTPKAVKAAAPKGKQPAKTAGKCSTKRTNTVSKAVSAKQTKATTSKASASKATSTKQAQTVRNDLVTVEIRIHNDAKGGHPHIMVDTVDDKNVSVGTTHDKFKGKEHKNIPLTVNPLGGNEQTYMRKQGTVDKKTNYDDIPQKGKMTTADNEKAKAIGQKAKEKYISQTKKK